MNEELVKKSYNKGEFIKILIDMEYGLDLSMVLTEIKNRVVLTPILGGGLNPDLKYEVVLTFDSEKIKINKLTKEVRVEK